MSDILQMCDEIHDLGFSAGWNGAIEECEKIANAEFDRQIDIIENATNDKALSDTGRASIRAIADSAALTAQRIASQIRSTLSSAQGEGK